ncbi:MAG TPA: hypothetical protein VGU01_15850 [Sphingomicrobium sp.]|nr:hypothetical protein [Sphingomicrobium sp.]
MSVLALAFVPASLAAQPMNMPGMSMSARPAKPRNAKHAAIHSRSIAKKPPSTRSKEIRQRASAPKDGGAPKVQDGQSAGMPMAGPGASQAGPMPAAPSPTPSAPMGMTMPAQSGEILSGEMATPSGNKGMAGMAMGKGDHAMESHGAYGPYSRQRESSGTAWQPDASALMGGPMLMSGEWMLMAHGTVNFVEDHQSGPRGNDKAFASGMMMGMATRPLGDGTLQLRAMFSPDPTMGPAGYPLLLATGETANGRTPLVDRQHPHDFVMELSASISQDLGNNSSVFLYAGLPGEPAFGPPAFMHREAILDSPEAPITHHWFDSTHISFGVITAGLVIDRLKVEASRFNAREPDQRRWNIETGPLDSTSIRISWNPGRTLAIEGSWGYFKDPEQLEPGVDQKRLSASVLWADEVAPGWHAATTLAWGRKTATLDHDDAVAAEASLKHAQWTLFGRAEMTSNRELLGLGKRTPAYRVGKLSLGTVRDFKVADHLSFGVGGLFAVNFVPDALALLYGGHNPLGAMGFVRLRVN